MLEGAISRFMSDFGVNRLLRQCGCVKEKGIAVTVLFAYIMGNAFRDGSFYMQNRMGTFSGGFSKNTYYRFLNNGSANWLRFITLLAARIIHDFLRPLTSKERDVCLVIDDSLYERAGFRRTELAARVFDHVSRSFKHGYRLLTLGWTDGCSFLPVNFSLLSSGKEENILGERKGYDRRTLCWERREMSMRKGTAVMVELLKLALKSGIQAKYVLFDSWFSNPRQLLDVRGLKLHAIAMAKRTSKVCYLFQGERKNIKQIFASCRKRRGRSKYLLSVVVQARAKDDKGNEQLIDARIVCVRNRHNRKDWLALISTDLRLSEEDIIRIYGKRWDIEVFFKTCKSYLQLRTGYHGLSYDGLTAHVAFVFTRYMLLSVAKRHDEDDRTLGELFYLMVQEMADLTFNASMLIIAEAMLQSVQDVFHATEEQIEALAQEFIGRLPQYMRNRLQGLVA